MPSSDGGFGISVGPAAHNLIAYTGVMLLSVAVPTSIVVAGNTISDSVNGVAFNSNITVVGHNRFAHVTNRYFRYTPRDP